MLFYGMHLNPACQLLSLDVSSNAMGLESAKAVAEFLQDDPPLHKLDLSGNFIEEEGAQCIQKSLTDNSNLWHMVLQKNHIPGELERDLEEHVHGKKMDFNAPPDPEAAQFMR
eukprot:TRINITY_DN3454_c0_g1_i11.p1 TRINITY_DN3454_c0_g1~~TRINITY_DN3454_c0_g1_i11.p1  ORF type:complete len:113 (-),score=35.90 TRINITY_DN3454_c0_g1_i11:504-842(-)